MWQNFFQPPTPLLERFVEQQSAVLVEQIKCRKTHGDFVLQPKIELFSAQPFLQLREWKRPRTVPSQDFSVQDQLTRQFCEEGIEFGKLHDFVERARKHSYSRGAFVNLGANAVILFLNQN